MQESSRMVAMERLQMRGLQRSVVGKQQLKQLQCVQLHGNFNVPRNVKVGQNAGLPRSPNNIRNCI